MRKVCKKVYEKIIERYFKEMMLLFLLIVMFSSISWILADIYKASIDGNVTEEVFVLKDQDGTYRFQDVLNSLTEFKKTEGAFITFESQTKVYWIRIPYSLIQKYRINDTAILFLDHPIFQKIEAYYLNSNGTRMKVLFNNDTALISFLALDQDMDIKGDLYLRIPVYLGRYHVNIVPIIQFFRYHSYLNSYIVFTMGILFAVFIIDILLAFVLKEKYFIFYAFFQDLFLIYVFLSSGMGKMYVGLAEIWTSLTSYAICITALLFLYFYLEINRKIKVIGTIYKTMAGICFVMAVISTILHYLNLYHYVVYFLGIVSALTISLTILVTLLIYTIKGHEISIFFLAGTFIQSIFIVILIVGNYVLTGESIIPKLGFMFAGAVNGVLFSLGIFLQLKDIKDNNEIFYKLAITDKLTGVYNRYYFDQTIRDYMDKRDADNLTLAILDIDHFKYINDRFGHDVGDLVLKELTKVIENSIRNSDILFRWGGEEFAILFINTPQDITVLIGERIRLNVEKHDFEVAGHITISIGEATYMLNEGKENWFKRADNALYTAKNSGRNCLKKD